MRSTSAATRHRGQQGTTLVEALVAGALLGITAVVGLTAWETAVVGARQATQRAWARCMARAEMEAVLSAPYSNSNYYPPPPSVSGLPTTVTASPYPGFTYANTQLITVVAGMDEPYTLTAIKTQLTSASYPTPWPFDGTGCPSP
jgi:Tfp pilus assembly protein PilE